jgi:ABC-2 type transport system permease protein
LTTTSAPASGTTGRFGGLGVTAIVVRAVADRARLAVLCGGGMALLLIGVAALFPSLEDVMAELSGSFPEGLLEAFGAEGGFASPEGWMQVEGTGLFAPIVMLAVALITGARALAGEEEAGTLELLLANPVSRTRVVAQKLGSVAAVVGFVGVCEFVGLVVGSLLAGLGLSVVGMAAAGVHLVLLGLLFGVVASLAGILLRDRKRGLYAGAGLAVLAYAVDAFAGQAEGLTGLVKASPWYYFNAHQPLVNGFEPLYLGVLTALAALMAAATFALFNRRDLLG